MARFIRSSHTHQQQQGMVLFFTVLALVLMTLGALAIYRSTDSATAIAGNISYREQGVAYTSRAIEEAKNALTDLGTDVSKLYADDSLKGYYASMYQHAQDGDMLKFDWTQAKKITASTPGYTVSYAIHRLCEYAGAPNDPGPPANSCVYANASVAAVKSVGDQVEGERIADSSSTVNSPYYRVTARALGPRNSESIVQVLIY